MFNITTMGMTSVTVELVYNLQLEKKETLVALKDKEHFSMLTFNLLSHVSVSHREEAFAQIFFHLTCVSLPTSLLQVWARKLFPLILFCSRFKILQLRS